ncbi:MAG: hypothetical protein AMJ92_08530 [candidate division Zixibacteria bacterium SM23_81]|nr:MAG: hypothetical protein AMJ92_08530 [candidate division Zixibacteria bacterium SM23_81]
MLQRQSLYLWEQITNHVALFFPPRAQELLRQTEIVFVPLRDALNLRKQAIAIPIDIPAPFAPERLYQVEFNGTNLTLWHQLPIPDGEGWSCLPQATHPLWFRHGSGTLIPAFNMFATMMDLLTLREERELPQRDLHGRFPAEGSPRCDMGLLEVPVFNEAVAALVAACAGLAEEGWPKFNLENVTPSVFMVLSHDCDILLGNDLITQAIRCFRIFQPLMHAKVPRVMNIWWLMRNTLRPKDFYFDNVTGMVEVERMFGCTSAFYMLNGAGGRFGARSGSEVIPQVCEGIPKDWQLGMHYNYDTFLDHEQFAAQKRELERLLKREIKSGRAHYLRFDPVKSWSFLAECGIKCDETVGYPAHVGYRCGIAGLFQPFDLARGERLDLWEVPMAINEGSLLQQYPRDPISAFQKILVHLSRLGGALSILIHPGHFFNPEFPQYLGLYRRILGISKKHVSRGCAALSLVEKLNS